MARNIKYDIQRLKKIPITNIMERLGYKPAKVKGQNYWYHSPFREEKTPSFKVQTAINAWYDFGEQEGGNAIDLITRLNNISFMEALSYLNDFAGDSALQPNRNSKMQRPEIVLRDVYKISNPALISYMDSRGVGSDIYMHYCREIHYGVKGREFYAVGFRNDKGGYELRNRYFKGCIGSKEITSFLPGYNRLSIFEGFIDFLSYLTLNRETPCEEDIIVLNSVANSKRIIPSLAQYLHINLHLDNDDAGDRYTDMLKSHAPRAEDCRKTFAGYKDLNDYLRQSSFKK